jgi:ribosome-associated toxin RatA of RatAB toxin-antitoxin module
MIKYRFKKITYFYILFFITLAISLIYLDLTTIRSSNQTQSDHYSLQLHYGMTSENDLNKLFDVFSDLEKYPLYLPQYIQNVQLTEQDENISFYTVKTTLVSTEFLVKQTIDKDTHSQVVEILNGDAKNTIILQSFDNITGKVTFDTKISLEVEGILYFISYLPQKAVHDHVFELLQNIESISVDLDSVESKIDLIYREILHRPADSNGLDIFSLQITTNQLTYDELREILYESEEYSLIVDPLYRKGFDEIQDDTKKLINKLYIDILYREADVLSLLNWASLLESEKITINEIQEILLNSDEKKSLLEPDQRKKFSELKDDTRILLEETYQEILMRHVDIRAAELYGSLLEANKITIEEIRQILYESGEYLYSPYIVK